MSKLPIDIFFETLLKTNSKEEAFKALQASFVKRKLSLVDVIKYDATNEFKELWSLIERERSLRKILESKAEYEK